MAINNVLKLNLTIYDGPKIKRCKVDGAVVSLTFPGTNYEYLASTDADGNLLPFSAPYAGALYNICWVEVSRAGYRRVKVMAAISWVGQGDTNTGTVSVKTINLRKIFG